MRMAADHNFNFPYGGAFPQPFCDQRVVSFQPGTTNSATGIVPGGMNVSGGVNGSGMMLTGNSSKLNSISSLMSTSNSPRNALLDPVHGLKHRAKFSVDWSNEELELLKQGIVRHASEPTIMKYIKIAAMLPDKTVRDVAMRCRWMTKKENSKRRKPEDSFAGKKIKDRKDKLTDASSMPNMHCNQLDSAASYSYTMHAAPVIDSRTKQLLNDNVKLLHQIAINLEYNEIQNNVDLLYCSKENITAILNSMSGTPGIMSRMPPLPVHIDENLIHCISPCIINAHELGNNHFKEEPGCW
ncbi:hypothetical protein Cni_G18549 [Canna indica]|uniref:Uncharacterized protein n=1 Tax=Canna indica TaxID=4628 RepID=A0AAQ3QHP4_9LILI|nr:hypothetical protein Cni_G18549 [Canna indica]